MRFFGDFPGPNTIKEIAILSDWVPGNSKSRIKRFLSKDDKYQ